MGLGRVAQTRTSEARQDTTPHGRNKRKDKNLIDKGQWGAGGWVRGTPGWGRSTIFLFCVVKLGWIPPARPPFTKPLEEILLLVSSVLCPHSAPLCQLYRTGELHLQQRRKRKVRPDEVQSSLGHSSLLFRSPLTFEL